MRIKQNKYFLMTKSFFYNRFFNQTVLNTVYSLILTSLVISCGNTGNESRKPERPNIVWIVAEDMSAHWSCYGEKTIQTPNIDRLAQQGVLFENAFFAPGIISQASGKPFCQVRQGCLRAEPTTPHSSEHHCEQ